MIYHLLKIPIVLFLLLMVIVMLPLAVLETIIIVPLGAICAHLQR